MVSEKKLCKKGDKNNKENKTSVIKNLFFFYFELMHYNSRIKSSSY